MGGCLWVLLSKGNMLVDLFIDVGGSYFVLRDFKLEFWVYRFIGLNINKVEYYIMVNLVYLFEKCFLLNICICIYSYGLF